MHLAASVLSVASFPLFCFLYPLHVSHLFQLLGYQSISAVTLLLFLSYSGWISALTEIRDHLAVCAVMMVVAAFFTVCAVLAVILLKMVLLHCNFVLI